MKELFKETIFRMYIDKDQEYLAFRLMCGSNDYVIYRADAGCCSKSWFESISNPEYLIGNEVIGIEEKVEREETVPETAEMVEKTLRIYGYTLKTAQGYTDIEFRNESNGYYGGRCDLVDDPELKVTRVAPDQIQLSFGEQGSKIILYQV
jgi:hypothetical protein